MSLFSGGCGYRQPELPEFVERSERYSIAIAADGYEWRMPFPLPDVIAIIPTSEQELSWRWWFEFRSECWSHIQSAEQADWICKARGLPLIQGGWLLIVPRTAAPPREMSLRFMYRSRADHFPGGAVLDVLVMRGFKFAGLHG